MQGQGLGLGLGIGLRHSIISRGDAIGGRIKTRHCSDCVMQARLCSMGTKLPCAS